MGVAEAMKDILGDPTSTPAVERVMADIQGKAPAESTIPDVLPPAQLPDGTPAPLTAPIANVPVPTGAGVVQSGTVPEEVGPFGGTLGEALEEVKNIDVSLFGKGIAVGTAGAAASTIRGLEASSPDVPFESVPTPKRFRSVPVRKGLGEPVSIDPLGGVSAGRKPQELEPFDEVERMKFRLDKERELVEFQARQTAALEQHKVQAEARFQKAKQNAAWVESFVPKKWKTEIDKANQAELLQADADAVNAWMATIGQQLPIIAETLGARAIGGTIGSVLGPGGTVVGGTAAGVGAMSLLEAGDFVAAADSRGVDSDIARKYASYYGPGSGAIEYAQNLWIGKSVRGAVVKGDQAKFVIKALKEIAGWTWEGAEEFSQNSLSNFFMQKAIGEHNMRHSNKPPLTAPSIGEGGLRAFVTGVGVAAATRGLGKGGRKIFDKLKGKQAGPEDIPDSKDEFPPPVIPADAEKFGTEQRPEAPISEQTPVTTPEPVSTPLGVSAPPIDVSGEVVEQAAAPVEPVVAEKAPVVAEVAPTETPVGAVEALVAEIAEVKPAGATDIKEGDIYALGDKFAVRGENESGFGDLVFNSSEEAQANIGQEADLERANAEFQTKQDKVIADKAETEAKKQAIVDDIDGFAEDQSSLQRGKSKKALNKTITLNGKDAKPRKDHIRGMVAKGNVELTIDEEPRIKPMSRSQFNRATQAEQDAHQKRMDAAGTKKVYRVNGFDLGKTGYDFAKFLMAKPAPVVSKESAEPTVSQKEKVEPKKAATPEEGTTGTRKEKTAEARAERGAEPVEGPVKQTVDDWVAEAQAEIDENADYTDNLMIEMEEDPRPITLKEEAALQIHLRTIHNGFNKALEDLDAAKKSNAADAEQQAENARRNLEKYEIKINQAEIVNARVGTLWGRMGVALQQEMRRDFSVKAMRRRASAAKGEKLTENELLTIEKQSKRIAELEEKMEQRDKEDAERASKRNIPKVIKGASRKVTRKRGRLISQEKMDETNKYFAALGRGEIQLSLLSPSPELVKHLTRAAINLVDQGVRTAAGFVADVLKASNLTPSSADGKKLAKHMRKVWKSKDVQDAIKTVEEGNTIASSEDVAEGIRQSMEQGQSLSEERLHIQQLAKSFAAEGITDVDDLIDAVHDVLKDINPDITRRDALDGIAGRGQFTAPTKAQVNAEWRDLQAQAKVLSEIQAIEAKDALRKKPRKEPSKKLKKLRKQLNDMKRRDGFFAADPAKQAATTLRATKKRLMKQISDLVFEISTRTRIVKGKTVALSDTQLEILKDTRDVLKAEAKSIFGNPKLTDAQRVARAIKATKTSIETLKNRIGNKDLFPQKKKAAEITDPDLIAAKAEEAALRAELKELQDLEDIEDPSRVEAIRNRQYEARVKKRIAELTSRMARLDFAPKPKKAELQRTKSNLELDFKLAQLKDEVNAGIARHLRANRTGIQKVGAFIGGSFELSRAIMTSFDLSAVGRQGFLSFLGHPLRVSKRTKGMLISLKSEKARHRVEEQIRQDVDYAFALRSDLGLTTGDVQKSEEPYASRFSDKIPGIALSERAYSTMLNLIRMDMFKALIRTRGGAGRVTTAEAKALANFVNVWTGRGGNEARAKASVIATALLFAPRLVASRFQVVTGQPLWKALHKRQFRVARLIATEYTRTLIGMATMYGIIALGIDLMWDEDDPDKPTIELDLRSSDALKVKVGETRFDLLAGLGQVTTFMARVITGKTKTIAGEIKSVYGTEVKFGSGDTFDVMTRFLRSKASPMAGTAINVLTGTNFIGEEVTAGSTAENLLVPMSTRDMIEAMQEHGVKKGAAAGMFAILGIGVQTHTKKGKRGVNSAIAQLKAIQKKADDGGKPLTPKQENDLDILLDAKGEADDRLADIKEMEAEDNPDQAVMGKLETEIQNIYDKVLGEIK